MSLQENLSTFSIPNWHLYERTTCRSCSAPIWELDSVLDMGVPYLNDFPAFPSEPEIPFPQQLVLCPECSLVQLRHTAPPDKLFRHFWYRSSVTRTMRDELKDVADSVLEWRRRKGLNARFVLDIGSNDGTLLSFYPKDIFRVGFEPAANLCQEAHGKANVIIPEYFKKELLPSFYHHHVSAITACAVFYDVDRPNKFISDVAYLLESRGLLLLQMNYLGALTIDDICHEHLCYYSLTAMENLLRPHGLKTLHVTRNNVNGGSFRLYISNFGEPDSTVSELLAWEEQTGIHTTEYFKWFTAAATADARRLRDYLWANKRLGKKIFVCGASTRGNTLLQYYQLGEGLFEAVGERDERKWGRYTVGTHIPIVGEGTARRIADIQCVLPWHFQDEIVKREWEFLARGGELVFPLPLPRSITKNGEVSI